MQGKKELVPKLMYQVQINDLVPENNFYRLSIDTTNHVITGAMADLTQL